jgi:hypothetical protein
MTVGAQEWSAIVCEALFNLGGTEEHADSVHPDMKLIAARIREDFGLLISKQFLHKKLSRLVSSGLVGKTRAQRLPSPGGKRRGRPLVFNFFLTERGTGYLLKKGVRCEHMLLSKKIDVLLLEAPDDAAPEKFVKSYYEKLGYSVIHTRKNQPPAGLSRDLAVFLAENKTGAPDLLVFKPDFSEYFFVECKTPPTGLSDAQIQWLLSSPHAPFKLVYVQQAQKALKRATGGKMLVRFGERAFKELNAVAGKLQARRKRPVSLDEALGFLLSKHEARGIEIDSGLRQITLDSAVETEKTAVRGGKKERKPLRRTSPKSESARVKEAPRHEPLKRFSLKHKKFIAE